MKRAFALIALIMRAGCLMAADPVDTSSSDNVSPVFGVSQVKENNLHSKVHTGALFALEYARRFRSRNVSELHTAVYYTRMKTTYEDLSATLSARFDIGYRYLFRIRSGGPFSFAAGPATLLRYDLTYYPKWDDSHLYWANQLSLAATGQMTYAVNESKSFGLRLECSALSLVSRPDRNRLYKIDDLSAEGILKGFHSERSLTSIGNAGYINASVAYRVQATPRFAITVLYGYETTHVKTGISETYRNAIHRIGFIYSFL